MSSKDTNKLNEILDNARDSVSNSKLEQMYLLREQDLSYVKESFNLINTSDKENIFSWINKLKSNSYIVFFKSENELSREYPFLNKMDFILIIINRGQLEMLLTYISDCVCIHGTNTLKECRLELYSLLILNELREAFPCAFLITNRCDEQVFSLFFKYIQSKCMQKICAKVFISDIPDFYYNAWVQEMHPAEFRLYCIWDVDVDWRKNLSKINSKEKQIIVYTKLRVLLYELDKTAFSKKIQSLIKNLLENEDTNSFGTYFQSNYGNKVSLWAYCYTIHCGINTNMHLERMHWTLQYLFINRDLTKTLHGSIHTIMKFIRDKYFEDDVFTSIESKSLGKKRNSGYRHTESEMRVAETNVLVGESRGFKVISKSSRIYTILEDNISCSCKMVCTQCDVCIHKYSCSCIDFAIGWNMCVHIHLVQMYMKSHPETKLKEIV